LTVLQITARAPAQCPNTPLGCLQRSPGHLAGLKGPTSKGRKHGKGKKVEREGREEKGGEEKVREGRVLGDERPCR